ncbi:MAG TPA: hypothetical protein V6C50_11955 [Crinalium sp.]
MTTSNWFEQIECSAGFSENAEWLVHKCVFSRRAMVTAIALMVVLALGLKDCEWWSRRIATK